MMHQPSIVIVGAGIVGLSTAYALLERGMRDVRILEQETVDHSRSTSSSISRLLRFEYGADTFYSCMVKLSLEYWCELARRTQRQLYTPTGLLNLGMHDDGSERAQEAVRSLGLASERLSLSECRRRFPQFSAPNYEVLTYNPAGGVLHASTCLQVLKRAILELGGEIREQSKVTRIAHEHANRPVRLWLNGGEEMNADRLVVATGPWVHRLLGGLQLPVRPTRQYLCYFAGLAPGEFGVGAFPAFIAGDLYGLPIHYGSHGWLKVASHQFGRVVDPDAPVQFEAATIARSVREMRALLPALRDAKLAHIEACMYDVSPDEDFIIDALPDDPRILFATGLSGHGFKFGPLLGRILSSLVCESVPEVPLGRFRLARFAHQQPKQVISVA